MSAQECWQPVCQSGRSSNEKKKRRSAVPKGQATASPSKVEKVGAENRSGLVNNG